MTPLLRLMSDWSFRTHEENILKTKVLPEVERCLFMLRNSSMKKEAREENGAE